jgi:dinuclear metal center YbgI/SA1388 family protein
MARKGNSKSIKLHDLCVALGQIAPRQLAQSWDNIGLLAGDLDAPVRKALLCIDLTRPVTDEAIRGKFDLVVAYHPPIFKPISSLTAQSGGPEAAVFRCITAGIAVYSLHTALDAAEGGTNDVIAGLCGIKQTEPLEFLYAGDGNAVKFVVFVPGENLEAVAAAMFTAGAGQIGDYSKCSYRLEGTGTFLGSDATNPTVGAKGRFETVAETRLEMVCALQAVPQVHAAMVRAHPYEEPAFDIYPLKGAPTRGIGRIGKLPQPVKLAALARKLKRAVSAKGVQIVGDPATELRRAIILVGAAGNLPFQAQPSAGDVIITGEIRHHDALSILRCGATAIALGHWTSERPVLQSVADRLMTAIPGVVAQLSKADREPFVPI